jgi:hypothetical protein
MQVVPDHDLVSITLQSGTGFWNDERFICLELGSIINGMSGNERIYNSP